MRNKRRKVSLLAALVAIMLIPLFGASTATAAPRAGTQGAHGKSVASAATPTGAERVIGRTTLRIPKDGKGNRGESAAGTDAVVFCFAELFEPFLASDFMVHSHVNVFCEQQIFSIYAEVLIFWNGQPYEPSKNFSTRLFTDVHNVTSFGTPCNTGSGDTYFAFGYVEVQGFEGPPDGAEIVSETQLRC